jgi:hypothetical protein
VNDPKYVGWIKNDGSTIWRRVCAAASWDECWIKLLRVPMSAQSDERVVRQGTAHP